MPVLYHSTYVLPYRQRENQENQAQPLSILQGRQKHYLNTNALPQTNEINSKSAGAIDGGCEIHEQDKCGHSFLSERKVKHCVKCLHSVFSLFSC